MAHAIDRTGQRFGRLVVLDRAPSPLGPGIVMWRCRCDCGTVAVFRASVLGRHTHSCGCLQRELAQRRAQTHGYTRHNRVPREYTSWHNAKRRCHDPAHKQFPDYGGRGITMCDHWRQDFGAFMADLGPCPPGYTLERINNDAGYEPDNCRWATPRTQSNNTRRNHWLTINGTRLTATEAARVYAVNVKTVNTRLCRGWSDEEAVFGRHGLLA